MKRWVAAIAAIVVLSGALIWWLNRKPVTVGANGSAGVLSNSTPAQTISFGAAGLPDFSDAGVGSVKGVLTDLEGAPVPGATIRVYAASIMPDAWEDPVCHQQVVSCREPATALALLQHLRSDSWAPASLLETETAADGTFVLQSVPAIDVTLIAQAGPLMAWARVAGEDLAAFEAEPLELQAEAAAAVRQLVADGDQPLPGVRVTFLNLDSLELVDGVSDAAGEVQVSLHSGEIVAVAEAPGRLAASVQGGFQVRDARDTEREPLNLFPAVRLIVKTVSGSEPIDADVEIDSPTVSVGEGPMYDMHPRTVRTVHGVVEVESLLPGAHAFRARQGSLVSVEMSVDVSEQHELTLDLLSASTLSISCIDADGNPIDGDITADLSSVGAYTTVTHPGVERLVLGPVTEGEYSLNVSADGFDAVSRTLDLVAGETSLEITLTSTRWLEGMVVDEKGQPVPDATVSRIEVDGFADHLGLTDELGAFRVPAPATAMLLEASKNSVGRGRLQWSPGADAKIRLKAAGALVLTFQGDEALSDPPQVTITNSRTGESLSEEELVDHRMVIKGLLPDLHTVDVGHPDMLPVKLTVQVPESGELRVRVELKPALHIEGTVNLSEGGPCDACIVRAATATHMSVTVTEPNGTFELKGFAPGDEASVTAELKTGGREGPAVKVKAPARNVTLTLAPKKLVTGVVVDQQGQPLTRFEVSGANEAQWPGGRFVVDRTGDTLIISALGFQQQVVTVRDRDDVGTVVMKPFEALKGQVVDASGQPVQGVRVIGDQFENSVTTSTDGSFSALLTDSTYPFAVNAWRGRLSGKAQVTSNAFVRIVLVPKTQVTGVVSNATGGQLTLRSVDGIVDETAMLDQQGRYSALLGQGRYFFELRGRFSTRVDVMGEQQTVNLGSQVGRCHLDVVTGTRINEATLRTIGAPAESEDFDMLVLVEAGMRAHSDSAPCGPAMLTVLAEGERVEQQVMVSDHAKLVITVPVSANP